MSELCVQVAATWVAKTVASLIALVLAVFLLVQLLWTWKTEGVKAALVCAPSESVTCVAC